MLIQEVNKTKVVNDFKRLKNFFCIYKMYLMSAAGYENARFNISTIHKLVKFEWVWKMYVMV